MEQHMSLDQVANLQSFPNK